MIVLKFRYYKHIAKSQKALRVYPPSLATEEITIKAQVAVVHKPFPKFQELQSSRVEKLN